MWLQARTKPDLDNEIAVSDYIDVLVYHTIQKLSFTICFGGVELGIDDEGLYDQFAGWKELVEAGIEEMSIEFEVPSSDHNEQSTKFTLTIVPDDENQLSAYCDEKSWHHLKLKEWRLVPL